MVKHISGGADFILLGGLFFFFIWLMKLFEFFSREFLWR